MAHCPYRVITDTKHAQQIKTEYEMLVAYTCSNGLDRTEAEVLANFYLDSLYGYPWQDRVQCVIDAG